MASFSNHKKFKYVLFFLVMFAFVVNGHTQIISQYVDTDSGTSPKGIEIWNNTESTLDFSSSNLDILKGTNGGAPSVDVTVSSGSLASGEVMVIGTTDIETYLNNNGLSSVTFVNKPFTFNGDDALVVKYGGNTTDTFGTPNSDPGTDWSGNGVSTKDQNIELMEGINTESSGFTDPSGRFSTVSTSPSSSNGLQGFGVAPNTSPVNSGPAITNIVQTPLSGNVTPSDAVSVSADITDNDGVASASLKWGTTSGSLTNNITMNLDNGNTYTTNSSIPDQNDGTTVYYKISATDNNSTPETTTSDEQTYTVANPPAVIAIQDFDNSTPEWTYTTDVPFFTNGSDGEFGIFDISSAYGVYTDPDLTSNVLSIHDLDDEGDNGTSGTAHIQFATINLSNSINVTFSFDYQVKGFDGPDFIKYELVYDGSAQTAVELPKNNNGTISISIPDAVDAASLIISIKQNGASDYAALDNFRLTGNGMAGNNPPVISNITQDPTDGNVNSSNVVSVSANITDSDGIASATLKWGTTSGSLTNSITMNNTSGDTYTITSSIPTQNDGTTVYYQVTATDANPTPATTTSLEKSYSVTDPLPPGDIIITEIMADPNAVTDENGEYFEVYNRTDHNIDMNGWTFSDEASSPNSFTIDASVVVLSHGFAVFGANADKSENDGVKIDFQYPSALSFSLANSSDEIVLTNPNETVIDKVEYNSSAGWPITEGASFYFTGNPTDNNNTASNWATSTQSFGISEESGSPGFSGEAQLPETYRYTDFYSGTSEWLPNDPSGISTGQDIIAINDNSANLTSNTTIFNITVEALATLQIEKILKFNNYIHNNGSLVFLSTASGTAQLDEVPLVASITGKITTQRYIPAGTDNIRAYRFVTSPVTTESSINENWQEGVHNTETSGENFNKNPKPGYGTHITGSTTGANGFDATGSGNPSLFVYDNTTSNLNEAWQPISNTDSESLEAGKAYRLFIRGDRSIDVTDNETTPTNTTLEMTGNLATGNQSETALNPSYQYYNYVGNPYQAVVNLNDVLAHSTNIMTEQYYAWDPHISDRGAYVTVDLNNNSNASGSQANQFLQPAQSFFVRTGNGPGNPELSFQESDKDVNSAQTTVFSNGNASFINLQLLSEGKVHDGLRINFDANATNEINGFDAAKLGNLDENLAVISNGDHYLSIEYRDLPSEEDILPLFTNQYKSESYSFKMTVENLPDVTVYLDDAYLDTHTEMENNAISTVDFSVDESVSESVDPNRFSISFENEPFGVKTNVANKFRIYPTLVSKGRFFVESPQNLYAKKVKVVVYNILGQKVLHSSYKPSQKRHTVETPNLQSGVYMVKLHAAGNTTMEKIIIQ